MEIGFWGAARTVTGSMHQVVLDGSTWLLDCGLYQGRREEAASRNRNFPFSAKSVDGVVLSHAHIDHSGNLPSLARNGYEGPVYTTSASADLCSAMLADAARIQEKDAEFMNKRYERRKRLLDRENGRKPIEPLYGTKDAERILSQFRHVEYHHRRQLNDELAVQLVDTGHLLGSAAMLLELKSGGKTVRLGFSGDVGRCCLPIIRDPESLPPVDYLIMESTYGNRLHKQESQVSQRLAEVVKRTAERGGRLIVPAFAVGRTQQLVLLLNQLMLAGEIPEIPVFVDSPLAIDATQAYRRHPECFDEETVGLLEDGRDPFGFRRLRYVRDAQDSKALNDLRGPMIIISASGMCEAGRILHHLKNNVGSPRNTVLITGFQAQHTLGRKLVDGYQEVNIFGEAHRVRAEVLSLTELSGHADQGELMRWIKPFARTVKKVFLVHGELEQSEPLADLIRETYGVEVHIPSRGDRFAIS